MCYRIKAINCLFLVLPTKCKQTADTGCHIENLTGLCHAGENWKIESVVRRSHIGDPDCQQTDTDLLLFQCLKSEKMDCGGVKNSEP